MNSDYVSFWEPPTFLPPQNEDNPGVCLGVANEFKSVPLPFLCTALRLGSLAIFILVVTGLLGAVRKRCWGRGRNMMKMDTETQRQGGCKRKEGCACLLAVWTSFPGSLICAAH